MKILIIASILFLILVGCGGPESAGVAPVDSVEPTATTAPTDPADIEPPTAATGPATEFGNGTWRQIGVDIAADCGTYRSAGPEDSVIPLCSFSRLKDVGGGTAEHRPRHQSTPTEHATEFGHRNH